MFDSIRTLLVWAFSLAFSWETVDAIGTPVKLCCYVVVVVGTLIYNGVITWIPNLRLSRKDGFRPVSPFSENDLVEF